MQVWGTSLEGQPVRRDLALGAELTGVALGWVRLDGTDPTIYSVEGSAQALISA
jgi:hypothetical protein